MKATRKKQWHTAFTVALKGAGEHTAGLERSAACGDPTVSCLLGLGVGDMCLASRAGGSLSEGELSALEGASSPRVPLSVQRMHFMSCEFKKCQLNSERRLNFRCLLTSQLIEC